MIKLLNSIILFLTRLTYILEERNRKHLDDIQNQSIKDLENNPSDWFNHHFGGVQLSPEDRTYTIADASETHSSSNSPRQYDMFQ